MPRRMLDLCRNLLRVALARIAALEEELDRRRAQERGDGEDN